MLFSAGAFAQPGVILGVTLSPQDPGLNKPFQWHAGLTWQIEIGSSFVLQPSAVYTYKSAKLAGETVHFGSVEFPIQFQWGWVFGPKGNFRPYVFGEPFVGVNINSDLANLSAFEGAAEKLEYGLGLGIGFRLFRHIQIVGRYVWDFGNIVKFNDGSYKEGIKELNLRKPEGIELSVALLF